MKDKNPFKIKIFLTLFITLFLFSFILMLQSFMSDYNQEKRSLDENISQIFEFKINEINQAFIDKQNEVLALSNLDISKNILNKKVENDDKILISKSIEFSNIFNQNLQNFIALTNNTPEELIVNSKFRNVSYRIRESYFTTLFSNRLNEFSYKNEILDDIENNGILDELINESSGSDFSYSFVKINSEEFFIFVDKIILNSEEFFIFTILNTKNYKVVKDVDEKELNVLNSLLNVSRNENLLFISNNGEVIFSLVDNQLIAQNLSNVVPQEVFFDKKSTVDFLGPILLDTKKSLGVFLGISPVLKDNRTLGYVGYVYDLEENHKIIGRYTKDNPINMYTVNNKGILTSPLNDLSILTQEIKSFNSKTCLNDTTQNPYIIETTDFSGEKVYSTFKYLDYIDNCIILEAKKTEIFDEKVDKIIENKIYSFILLILLSLVISYIFSVVVSNKYNIRNSEYSFTKSFFSYFRKINIWAFSFYSILALCIFSLFEYYILMNINFFSFDNFIDIGIALLSILIFKLSLHIKRKGLEPMSYAAFFIFFEKIIEIHLQISRVEIGEVLFKHSWVIALILFFGLSIFLLRGYRRIFEK